MSESSLNKWEFTNQAIPPKISGKHKTVLQISRQIFSPQKEDLMKNMNGQFFTIQQVLRWEWSGSRWVEGKNEWEGRLDCRQSLHFKLEFERSQTSACLEIGVNMVFLVKRGQRDDERRQVWGSQTEIQPLGNSVSHL